MTCKHTINKHVTWNLQQKKERSGTGSIDPRAPTKSHPTPGGGGVGHPPTLKFCQTHPPTPPPRGRVGRTLSKTLPRPPNPPPMKYIVPGTSEQLGMRPRCDPTIRTAPTNVYGRVSSSWGCTVLSTRGWWTHREWQCEAQNSTYLQYLCTFSGALYPIATLLYETRTSCTILLTMACWGWKTRTE